MLLVEEALERFVLQLRADGRSRHTIAQYRRHVLLFARWLDSAGRSGAVQNLDHEVLASFLASPAANSRHDGRPKRATSTNALRSSIRVFFRYLHEAGLVPRNPGRLIRRALCADAPPRYLSEAETRRLVETLEQASDPSERRDRALFQLMLETGVRLGSALAIDVGDVDLERDVILLRSTKGSRPERLFLTPRVREVLREYLRGREGALFQGRAGARMSARHARRRLDHWLERAGIPRAASPHTLRHTFGQRLYTRTGDIALVKRALHHRSIASTLVYARAEDERLREALAL